MQHIAVLDDIILAFEPEFAGLPRPRFALKRGEIRVGYGLGANKTLFEIGVDHASCLWRPGSLRDGPGAGFLGPHSEKSDQPQKPITRPDDAVQPRLGEANSFEIVLPLILG